MKKFLFLSLIFSALFSAATFAQGTSGPAAKPQTPPPQQPTAEQMATMLQKAKEQQVPPMVEKTGLTEAQANRVIEINFEIRQSAATVLQGLEGDARAAKLAELKATKEKKYSEIPLTPEQIKAVYAFYEDMGKNAPQRSRN